MTSAAGSTSSSPGPTFIRWSDMRQPSQSTWAIWIACVGIGLLYLVRSFQNYMAPMFGQLSHGTFSFSQVIWLATAFLFPQSICAPFVGWYADRTSIRFSLL